MTTKVALPLVLAVTAALLVPGAALADDGDSLLPCSFQRILDGDIDKELDPDGAPPPEPENPAGGSGLEGDSAPGVPISRMTTTANFRMNLMTSGVAINDTLFRGEVEYGDFWSTVLGADANLNINIIPLASIYVAVGFQYALSSGAQPYGQVGTGTEGEYEFSDTFFVPVLVGLKISIPFLAPPSTWFNPRKGIVQGPMIRVRAAGGVTLVSDAEITVLSGAKASTTPYTFWDEWAWGGAGFAAVGFEYKIQEAFTFFVELAVHVSVTPEASSSDMSTILNNPGSLEPAALVAVPFLIGVTFNW